MIFIIAWKYYCHRHTLCLNLSTMYNKKSSLVLGEMSVMIGQQAK